MVRDDYLKSNMDTVARFTAMYLRALDFMKKNKAETLIEMKRFYDKGGVVLSPSEMDAEYTTRDYFDLAQQVALFDRSKGPSKLDEIHNRLAEFFKSAGTIPAVKDPKTYVNPDVLAYIEKDPKLKAFAEGNSARKRRECGSAIGRTASQTCLTWRVMRSTRRLQVRHFSIPRVLGRISENPATLFPGGAMSTTEPNVFEANALPAERLEGVGCVITGGASGIGFEVARELARLGGAVGILDLHEEAARSAALRITKEYSCIAAGVAANVADADAVNAAFHQLDPQIGPIGVLINCAGIMTPRLRPLTEMSISEFEEMLDVHVKGTFICSRAALPGMQRQFFGASSISPRCLGSLVSRSESVTRPPKRLLSASHARWPSKWPGRG